MEYETSGEDIHQADLGNMLRSDAEHHRHSMGNSLLRLLGLPRRWHCHVGGGYTVLPANVKPHVVAAMFNMETPVNGTEQGQMQVCAKVIVDRRVILHHVVAKRAVALGRRFLLPVLCHHPGLRGSDTRNGVQCHETV